jgi:hypothetical protein
MYVYIYIFMYNIYLYIYIQYIYIIYIQTQLMKEFDRLSQIHDGEAGGASRSGGGVGDNSGNSKTYILEHVLAAGISALRSAVAEAAARMLTYADVC